MKRLRSLLVPLTLLGAAACLVYLGNSRPNADTLNGGRLIEAIRAYSQDLRAQGVPVPATVSLQELIQRGLVHEADVSAFQGMEVQIHLGADETRPGDVLALARLPDGGEIVALADGSVQQRRR